MLNSYQWYFFNLDVVVFNKLWLPAISVPLLSVACLFVTFVFIVSNFPSIFGLSHASTPVIVKLLSSAVSVKFLPMIFFNLDVVVSNKFLLPVIGVPKINLFCLLSNLPLIVVKN